MKRTCVFFITSRQWGLLVVESSIAFDQKNWMTRPEALSATFLTFIFPWSNKCHAAYEVFNFFHCVPRVSASSSLPSFLEICHMALCEKETEMLKCKSSLVNNFAEVVRSVVRDVKENPPGKPRGKNSRAKSMGREARASRRPFFPCSLFTVLLDGQNEAGLLSYS